MLTVILQDFLLVYILLFSAPSSPSFVLPSLPPHHPSSSLLIPSDTCTLLPHTKPRTTTLHTIHGPLALAPCLSPYHVFTMFLVRASSFVSLSRLFTLSRSSLDNHAPPIHSPCLSSYPAPYFPLVVYLQPVSQPV